MVLILTSGTNTCVPWYTTCLEKDAAYKEEDCVSQEGVLLHPSPGLSKCELVKVKIGGRGHLARKCPKSIPMDLSFVVDCRLASFDR